MKTSALMVLALAASSLMSSGQQPRVTDSQFESVPLSLGLSATVDRFRHSNSPLWLGYAVQALPRTRLSACSSWAGTSEVEDGCCNELRLEDTANNLNSSDQANLPAPTVYVLLRLDQGEIDRVRVTPAGCTLNAGGLHFAWLNGVGPEESAVFLGKEAEKADGTQNHLVDETLRALSVHATPKATSVLISLAGNKNSNSLREKAAFWLGAQRGHDGLLALRQLMSGQQDNKFREKLIFDISINSDPGAMDDLIQLAKSDNDSRVRAQALFWLAQKAGKKAMGTLNASVENDPSLEVKKKAVFAISQLPKDESVPQLVHIADTNANFAIRKEAIFWLGQSQDPRALAYIEGVLKR
ncbi:MAG TPA: HEAT repeat domain-containing protein [Acidobacteriaceae bacterium]|nr:HEAT repeat domain-containing protein [Acidobacteriaceae bacterium]